MPDESVPLLDLSAVQRYELLRAIIDADGFLSDIGIVSLKVSTEAAAALRSLTHTNWHGLADE